MIFQLGASGFHPHANGGPPGRYGDRASTRVGSAGDASARARRSDADGVNARWRRGYKRSGGGSRARSSTAREDGRGETNGIGGEANGGFGGCDGRGSGGAARGGECRRGRGTHGGQATSSSGRDGGGKRGNTEGPAEKTEGEDSSAAKTSDSGGYVRGRARRPRRSSRNLDGTGAARCLRTRRPLCRLNREEESRRNPNRDAPNHRRRRTNNLQRTGTRDGRRGTRRGRSRSRRSGEGTTRRERAMIGSVRDENSRELR